MRISDWSSDVCSSDLPHQHRAAPELPVRIAARLCLPHAAARLEPRARNAILPALSLPHPARAAIRLDHFGAYRGGRRCGGCAARRGGGTRLSDAVLPALEAPAFLFRCFAPYWR